MDDKRREARLRRLADRAGVRIEKSRRRDTLATDFGMYSLIDVRANAVAIHGHVTLDDIEAYLIS